MIAVVRAQGMTGATTRAIAAEAGVAEGSIYRYFGDKIDLVQTAIREYLVPSYVKMIHELPGKAGTAAPATHLGEVLRRTMTYYRDLVPLLASLYAENEMRERFQSQTSAGNLGPHRASEGVAAYIAREISLGRLAAGIDPQAAAQMLLGACFQQVFFEQIIGADRLHLSERSLIAKLVQNVTRGDA